MKLYTDRAPNPFKVTIFLLEKDIAIPTKTLDIMSGDTQKAEFTALNSLQELPLLQLDDGTCLTESIAICRYLEALHPAPALMGETPLEAAQIEMWNRRMELHLFEPTGDYGRHVIPYFAYKIEQMPDYAETLKRRLHTKWIWLNEELSDGRSYVCNDTFSVADITGMAVLFIQSFLDLAIPDELAHARRWQDAVQSRKSWRTFFGN